MTLGDWMLMNGIWLGFKSASGRREHPAQWILAAAAAGLAAAIMISAHLISNQTASMWWIVCGFVLEGAAVRQLLGRRGDAWTDWMETGGTVICLGLGTGLWSALTLGLVVGILLAVSSGDRVAPIVEKLSAITVGAVGLNDLWAGFNGNLPSHHLSWLWAVPWLIAGDLYATVAVRTTRWPKPEAVRPQWRRLGGFGR